MPKEILLYSSIQNWTVEMIINKLEENMGEEVSMRVNSPGGDAIAAWGLNAKIEEHGNVTLQYDGMGASAAANLILYAASAECLDVSTFMFHRAASYNEDDPETKAFTEKVNADMKKKLLAKVTAETWRKVTGYTVEEMFSMDKRLNVWLDAKQMKELGLITKVKKLKPSEQKAMAQAMAEWNFKIAASAEEDTKPTQKPVNMTTLAELKEKFPALYALAIAEGEKEGIKKEKDRVGAWLAYAEIDPKKVAAGIKSGEGVSQTAMAEFQVAALSSDYLAKLKKDSAKDVTTAAKAEGDVTTETKKDKEINAFASGIDKLLGIKKEAAKV